MSARLLELWADIAALHNAAAVLSWDQETHMPAKGLPARGRTLAALTGMAHDRLIDPELDDVIAAIEAEPRSEQAAHQARLARRAVRRAHAVPGDLARTIAETRSRAQGSWQQALAEDDFDRFAPDLDETIRLTQQKADAFVAAGIGSSRYDTLLDGYEPGATEANIAPLLASLRDELAPLVQAAADSGVTVDESVCGGDLPGARQEAFGRLVAAQMGYDFEAGRLDESAHPFTTSFDPADVRFTWRWSSDDFRPGLFGIMHEAGHGLYEQGLPPALAGTPLGSAVSLGMHESQSRLWENLVGRTRAFWQWAMPHYVEHLGSSRLADMDAAARLEALWPALHAVRPSLIRVEADEATYNLHIVARFEIERRLVAGELDVGDLPSLWDDTYEDLLGVRAQTMADGVLQDIHWSMGAFGYFPTYTLGNLIACQLRDTIDADIGDLDHQMAAGEFGALLSWLREHIHAQASTFEATELVERATGRPLDASSFLDHIRTNVEAVYR